MIDSDSWLSRLCLAPGGLGWAQKAAPAKAAVFVAPTLYFALAAAGEPCGERFEIDALQRTEIEEIEGWPLQPDAAYTVASTRIIRQEIFDTDDAAENKPLFRLANRWHVKTRERAIRRLLLFSDGDTVDVSRLAESERLLRAKRFIYDARVIANRACGRKIDIVVVTRDVWARWHSSASRFMRWTRGAPGTSPRTCRKRGAASTTPAKRLPRSGSTIDALFSPEVGRGDWWMGLRTV